jgi:hypothetical protein
MPVSFGDYFVRIDSDGNATLKYFAVERQPGGLANRLLTVNQGGVTSVYGTVNRAGAHEIVGSSTTIASFRANSAEVARVNADGVAEFLGGLTVPGIYDPFANDASELLPGFDGPNQVVIIGPTYVTSEQNPRVYVNTPDGWMYWDLTLPP